MAQAAQQRAQLAELAALPLRAEALGADRQRNRYWLLGDGCGRGRLYVEEITAPWPAAPPPPPPPAPPTPSRGSKGRRGGGRAPAPAPSPAERAPPPPPPPAAEGGSSWRFYRSRQEVRQLVASLDERGVNERALKRALQAATLAARDRSSAGLG